MESTTTTVSRLRRVPSTLKDVLEYQNEALVLRFERKLGMSRQEAEQLFVDTKQFLYLCGVSEKPIAPTSEIDAGWHEFILCTHDYAEFCQEYFGRFIHHRPRRDDDPPSNGDDGRRAIFLAQQLFGDNLSSNWHPHVLITAGCNPDTGGCNCSPDTGGGGSECSPE